MHIYAGNPGVCLERVDSIADGAQANVSKLDLGVHSGTHVDAPLHFIDGAPGAETLPLDALVGDAFVVDATSIRGDLDEEALSSLDVPQEERLLLKTTNSQLWERPSFTPDFVRLTGSGARYLLARGVRLVGIDYLSIGDGEAHRELLGAGVVAVEGPTCGASSQAGMASSAFRSSSWGPTAPRPGPSSSRRFGREPAHSVRSFRFNH